MKIIKKLGGIILILAAFILSFATVLAFLKGIVESIKIGTKSGAEGLGYFVGCLMVVILVGILIFFMIKWGVKFIKNKTIPEESIDDIGL